MIPKIDWPEGKQFTLIVFDDPDGDTVASRKWVYPLLANLGFRTTTAGARSSKQSVARYLSQLDTADRQELGSLAA
jgi:hypothetical protein